MADPENVDQWITDARKAGLPVMVLGTTLALIAGLPLTVAAFVVLLPMFLAQLAACKRLFFPAEVGEPPV